MATCSSILAWRTPQTEKPDGLQSTGPQRIRHNLATKQKKKNTVLLRILKINSNTVNSNTVICLVRCDLQKMRIISGDFFKYYELLMLRAVYETPNI